MAMVHHPAVERGGRPAISVCIANYNGEQMLADCIESILAQVGAGSVEVIVHDDASTDGSVALLQLRYPQVELLVSTSNVGFCVSNNRMVAVARGEFVLLLNNDAALFPNALATLREAARAKPSAILTLPQFDWISGDIVDRGCLLDPFYNPVPNLDPMRRDVAYVIGACLWIPRPLWDALGGAPEWMGSIAEDIYLCGLARLRGAPVRVLPNSGYRHRQGTSFGGNRVSAAGLWTSVKRRRLSERNKTRALFVLTPGIAVWPLLASHLVALAIEGSVLSALRRDATLWREVYAPAIATPFREARMLLALRRNAQATRTASLRSWFSAVDWRLRKVALLARYGVPEVY